jgi:hypothetical protein
MGVKVGKITQVKGKYLDCLETGWDSTDLDRISEKNG